MEIETIKHKIYELRSQRVMLDVDLAALYQVETRVLNQAVKRNSKRFPPDFMFQLTSDEWTNLKSQFVTSSWGGIRKRPFAFTEQGLAMLSGVLSSDIAIQVNINIMRAFVTVRQLATQPDRLVKLEKRVAAIETSIEEILADANDINEDTRMQIELLNEAYSRFKRQERNCE